MTSRTKGWVRTVLKTFSVCLIPTLSLAQTKAQISAAGIYERTHSSVVVVIVADKNSKPFGQGSGFIVAKDRVVTNHHVVQGAQEALVVFEDGTSESVEGVVADSPAHDLTILVVKTGARSPLKLGDELAVRQGDSVYALGAPRGLESSLTNGIVSGFRTVDEQFLIQTTAPIAPGSSGGPLFDSSARVIGVTTSLLGDSPGIYFSIGANDVKRLLRSPNLVSAPLAVWSQTGRAEERSAPDKPVAESSVGSPEGVPSGGTNLSRPSEETTQDTTKIWKNLRDGRIYRTRFTAATLYLESLDDPLNRVSDFASCEFHRAVSIGLSWVGDCWARSPKDQSIYKSAATLSVFSETRIEGSTGYIPKFAMVPASDASGQESKAGLYVSSNPPSANVFINGIKHVGQTPTQIPLAPGEYDVVLKLEGYEPYAAKVQVNNEVTKLDVTLNKRVPHR